MSTETNVRFPQADPAETQLRQEQTALLQQQRDILSQQYREQRLLAPILFRQLGIEPVMDDQGNVTGYNTMTTPESQQAAEIQRQQLSLQQELLGLAREQAKPDPNAAVKAESEKLLAERSLAALRGELPVNPALITQLNDEERALRESYMRALGPGYETSTPFVQAMDQFARRKNDILEASRRGDISLADSLGLAREQSTNQRLTLGSQLGIGQGASGREAINNFLTSAAGVQALPNQTLSQFNGAVAGGQGLLNYYLGNRQGGLAARVADTQAGAQLFGNLTGLLGGVTSGVGSAGGALGAAAIAASTARLKKDITPLDRDEYRAALKRVRETPITRYRYKGEPDDREKHIGPILELSPKEIHHGDGTHVSLLDYIGLVHASVKGLDREVVTLRKAIHG